MFILLRRIERWLHQHIFKVGWLITKNFQTTTILYYTFFLPGVVLQQSIYWLVAGMLNVRGTIEIPFFKREPKPEKTTKQAKGAVPLPEKPPQTTIDISKLKPNFVTLDFSGGRRRGAPKGTYRKAIISTMPLLVALVCIWLIATRIFNIMDVVAIMATGTLPDIGRGIGILTGAPNFWLWIYIVFTLANTMFPPVPDELRGWRIIIVSLVAIGLALTVIGIGGEIFEVLQTPVATLVNVMQIMLILIIAIDILMVLVLGLIEYTIEHFTGHTATFRGDTMEVMTREEAIAARERELEKQRRQEERMLRQRNKAADTGPTSVYMLAFPLPGAPNEVGVTPVVEPKPQIKAEPERPLVEPAASTPAAPVREKPEDLAARIHIPERKPLVPRQPDVDDEGIDEDEDELQPVGIVTEPIVTPLPRPEAMLEEAVADEDVIDSKTEEISLSDFMRRPVAETNTDEDEQEDDEIPSRRPISLTPASRFNIAKPASNDSDEVDEDDEEPAVASSRPVFSSPVTQAEPDEIADETDDEEVIEPVSTASSRFGVSPFKGLSSKAEDVKEDETDSESEDDEQQEQPVGTVKEPITTSFVAPFTTSPSSDETDTEGEADEQPAASVSSRFGVSPFRGLSSKDEDDEADESPAVDMSPAKPKGLLSRPAEEDHTDVEGKEQPTASVSSRFGVSPFRGLSSKDVDNEADESPAVDMSPARPKGLLSHPAEEEDAEEESDEKPAASVSSRFGVSPFRGLSSKTDEGEDAEDKDEAKEEKSPFAGLAPAKPKGLLRSQSDDDDDEKPALSRPLSRTGTTPFANRFQSQADDDDEDEDDDESMLRRGRGDDAVSSLFGGLGTQADDDEDDDDEPSYSRSRFGGLGQTPSRFGSRRSVIGRSTADDDEYDDDDDDEYIDYDDVDYVDDDD